MSLSVLPMFSSEIFIVSGLTFKSLIHFEFILCMILGSVLVSFFYMQLSSFPSTTYWRDCLFSIVYIPASFVKDKVPIGVWVYLWAFYLVPLFYISVFCASTILSWWLKLCSVDWSQEGWFLQLCFYFSKLLWLFGIFCVSTIQIVNFFCSNSVKNRFLPFLIN